MKTSVKKLEERLNKGKETNKYLVLEFEGIDNWNRPVFKDNIGDRYGSVDILFSYEETKDNVLKAMAEDNSELVYFGKHFGCEPMGNPVKQNIKIKIVDRIYKAKVFINVVRGVIYNNIEELINYYGSEKAIHWDIIERVVLDYDRNIIGAWE